MSSRDEILASIRANRPQVERPLPAVPLFDADRPTSLLAAFKESLERMGGLFLDPPPAGDVLAPVRAKIANAKVVCSTAPEIEGNLDIARISAPQDLANVDFAIAAPLSQSRRPARSFSTIRTSASTPSLISRST